MFAIKSDDLYPIKAYFMSLGLSEEKAEEAEEKIKPHMLGDKKGFLEAYHPEFIPEGLDAEEDEWILVSTHGKIDETYIENLVKLLQMSPKMDGDYPSEEETEYWDLWQKTFIPSHEFGVRY